MIVRLTVNGTEYERDVEPRLLLSDFIRNELSLTGTHVGCEHGVCGACTVLFDGEPARSCIMLAVQADGHAIQTVEGLSPGDGALSPIQQAFRQEHALQCGFCTPGFLMTCRLSFATTRRRARTRFETRSPPISAGAPVISTS